MHFETGADLETVTGMTFGLTLVEGDRSESKFNSNVGVAIGCHFHLVSEECK
jgi:hypothetical protein